MYYRFVWFPDQFKVSFTCFWTILGVKTCEIFFFVLYLLLLCPLLFLLWLEFMPFEPSFFGAEAEFGLKTLKTTVQPQIRSLRRRSTTVCDMPDVSFEISFNLIGYYQSPSVMLQPSRKCWASGAAMAQVVGHLPPMQASHQCGPSSISFRCGLSLLLVLVLAPRGFSSGTPVFPSTQKPTFQIPIDSEKPQEGRAN